MPRTPRTDVILTPEACLALGNEPVAQIHLKDGRYVNCVAVEEKGGFLELEILYKHDGKEMPFHLSIPPHYVLYMIRAAPDARRSMGFKDED
ncbi:MAG TPA: hypothetical protein VGS07_08830 [Thermoanaerobaculia bacterium]|jgi:hypothetical protein|nr:hypothetical protein [Thermoanaerobaculia bacterium]